MRARIQSAATQDCVDVWYHPAAFHPSAVSREQVPTGQDREWSRPVPTGTDRNLLEIKNRDKLIHAVNCDGNAKTHVVASKSHLIIWTSYKQRPGRIYSVY